MATVSIPFVANAARITLTGRTGSDGIAEYSNMTNHEDPVVRAVAREFAANGTTSGTVTITAA